MHPAFSAGPFHAYGEERRPLWMLFSGPCAFGVLGMCFPSCLCSCLLLQRHDAHSRLGQMVSQGKLLPSEDRLNGQPAQRRGCHEPWQWLGGKGLGGNRGLQGPHVALLSGIPCTDSGHLQSI